MKIQMPTNTPNIKELGDTKKATPILTQVAYDIRLNVYAYRDSLLCSNFFCYCEKMHHKHNIGIITFET
jgi:hypothetical protein